VRAEHWLGQAGLVSQAALGCGALVPLETRVLTPPGLEPFVLRQLLSRTPRHLLAKGPKPNPFLPWDRPLQVGLLGDSHVLLLNKYPVQPNHLLVISQTWKPQDGWLEAADWGAVATVAADTGGLWFFNSEASAGASQPHRHLQVLPRRPGEVSCPLAAQLETQLRGDAQPWPWAYRLSPRRDPRTGSDLADLYRHHAADLGLGSPESDGRPRHPYNLLFDDRWFLTVRRRREHEAGFSINALGFAGFLLSTERSDRGWLERNGPWALLAAVAAEGEGRVLAAG
jgi:ATP adenylyltransferase